VNVVDGARGGGVSERETTLFLTTVAAISVTWVNVALIKERFHKFPPLGTAKHLGQLWNVASRLVPRVGTSMACLDDPTRIVLAWGQTILSRLVRFQTIAELCRSREGGC
jgi:hypothetical protein